MKSLFGNQRIRFDPWSADYGASLMAAEENEWLQNKVIVDPSIEVDESRWAPIECRLLPHDNTPVAFVDGVRRIESNLVFEHEGGYFFGAFACCAAGAIVMQPGRMNRVEQALKVCSVQRYLLAPETVDAPEVVDIPQDYPAGSMLPHQVIPLAANDPQEPLRRLQQLMRQEEALVAEQVQEADADLVIADGLLSVPLVRPGVAGFIKSLHTFYLSPDLYPVLASLRKHQRTPLFLLAGEDSMERYSAYVRINDPRPQDTVLAGIARFEVSSSPGMDAALRLMDRCAAIVPLFASPYGRDPRAPQNLLPISALEIELRRRLGSQEILKRFYQQFIALQETA